jgi:hypothetical protein
MLPQGSWGSTTFDGETAVTQQVTSHTFAHHHAGVPCQGIPPRSYTEAERTNRPRAPYEGNAEQGHGKVATRQHRFSTVPARCGHLRGNVQSQLGDDPGATLQPTAALHHGTITSRRTQPQHRKGREFMTGSVRLIEISLLQPLLPGSSGNIRRS